MTATTDTTSAPALDAATIATARRVIFFTVFLDILGFGIIIPQLANYAVNFGATPFVAGILASTYSAMGFVFMPFWGRLSDRIGRRPVLLYSIFGTGLGYILFALATSLPFLFAARAIDGITGANISTAQAYVADITPAEERSKYFAMFGAIFGIGFALGPGIGWLLSHLPGVWGGNLGLGAFSAALSFVNWALAVGFLPETLHSEIRKGNKERHDLAGSDYFNIAAFSRALGLPNLNVVIVIGFLATCAFATMQGTYAMLIIKQYVRPSVQSQIRANPEGMGKLAIELDKADRSKPKAEALGNEIMGSAPAAEETHTFQIFGRQFSFTVGSGHAYAKALGGDFDLPDQTPPPGLTWARVEKLIVGPQANRSVGELFAAIGLLSILIQGGLVRRLPKKMGEVNMVLAGTLIMAIGLAFIPVPRVYSGQFIAIAILTLGNGLSTPVLSSLVSQLSPEAERGEILGVFQSLQSLGRICGPLIGSALFNFASYSTPFIVGGLIMLSSFLLALKLRKANISPAQNYGGLAQGEDTSSGGSPLAEAQ